MEPAAQIAEGGCPAFPNRDSRGIGRNVGIGRPLPLEVPPAEAVRMKPETLQKVFLETELQILF